MYKTVDLFAGAGGLSYGFESTGMFKVLAVAEINKNAQNTFLVNHDNRSEIRVISDVRGYNFKELSEELNGIDVVIGGPPCQGFSNANRQKNHIISMNNSLVKEYFRAVREIKPKAFVMENVNMLSSSTHKFYDSDIDHDIVSSLGVEMEDDELIVSDRKFNEFDLMGILHSNADDEYRITESLFHLLNVLYKNRNNNYRLTRYLDNKRQFIIEGIKSQKTVMTNTAFLGKLLYALSENDVSSCFDELGEYIQFQKSFRLIDELKENKIRYTLEMDKSDGRIIAKVKSYSVINYVNKILGDDYRTKSGVINSIWFGVPQYRKRFIMIGIRSDVNTDKEIVLPFDNKEERVTVGAAINDLINYDVSDSDNEPEIMLYHPDGDNPSNYAIEMRKGSIGVSNHIVPKTRDKAKQRFESLSEGQNFHDLDKSMKDNYAVPERTQNSIYLRLDASNPSGTVINVRKSMWIHPTLNRAISVREAARLQSFPDKFVFLGTKDSQYQQVGNAVPPLMARSIANVVIDVLK